MNVSVILKIVKHLFYRRGKAGISVVVSLQGQDDILDPCYYWITFVQMYWLL